MEIGFCQTTFQTDLPLNPSDIAFDQNENGEIFITKNVISSGEVKIYLAKLDKNGNLLFSKVFTHTPNPDFYPQVVTTSDGGCILASESFSYATTSIKVMLIWKLDADGNIEWERIMDTILFNDLIKTQDGAYLFLEMDYEDEYNAGAITLHKLGEDGETCWSTTMGKKIPEPPDITVGIPVTRSSTVHEMSGYYYVAGRFEDASSLDTTHGRLFKLDLNGNLIWELQLPAVDTSHIRGIIDAFKLNERYYFKGDDGTYEFDPITAEYQKVQNSINMSTHRFGENYGVKCNKVTEIERENGATYFSQYSSLNDRELRVELGQVPDPGFVLNYMASYDGGHLILSSLDTHTLVTKVDCLGNDYWSNECNSKLQEEWNIALFPNPTTNILYVETDFEIQEVELFDLTGRSVVYDIYCYCKSHELNVSNLSGGTYRIVVQGENERAVSSFVKF